MKKTMYVELTRQITADGWNVTIDVLSLTNQTTDILIREIDLILTHNVDNTTSTEVNSAIHFIKTTGAFNGKIEGAIMGTDAVELTLLAVIPMVSSSHWEGVRRIPKSSTLQIEIIAYGTFKASPSIEFVTGFISIVYEEVTDLTDYFVQKKSPAEQSA